MNRLAKKDLISTINHTMCSGSRLVGKKMFAQIITELCEYKTIEEELGIDLITLFSALKYGVYYLASDGQLIHDYVSLTNNYIDVGAHDKLSYSFMTFLEKRTLLFTDYSKTWALTKEELEGNKNGN